MDNFCRKGKLSDKQKQTKNEYTKPNKSGFSILDKHN